MNFFCKFSSFCVSGFNKNDCYPFVVQNMQVGLIRPDVFKELLKYPEVFFIKDVREGDSEVFFKALIRYGKI